MFNVIFYFLYCIFTFYLFFLILYIYLLYLFFYILSISLSYILYEIFFLMWTVYGASKGLFY
ncbi:hypothetical protein Bca4012_089172 [Brassica carinata]